MKTFLANLLLLGFTLLLLLAGAELVYRLLPAQTAPRNDRPAFYYSSEDAPDLRDRAYSAAKPAGTFRIAVVGDSFSFAPYMQFDDTFAKRLERMLNLNKTSSKVEVINYGLPRLSTSNEVKYVEQAVGEGADLVILQITLNDAELKPYAPGTGLLSARTTSSGDIEFDSGLFAHWKFGAFVLKRYNAWRSRGSYESYFLSLFEKRTNWKVFHDSLGRIHAICERAHVPLAGVVFPLLGTTLDDYPFEGVHRKIIDALGELKFIPFDLLPAFRGMQADRLQVLPGDDRHPNEIAHRIAAEAIYDFLEKSELVPVDNRIRVKVLHRIGADLSTANRDIQYSPAATVAPTPHD